MITLIVFGKHYFLIVFFDIGQIRLANPAVSKASTKRMKSNEMKDGIRK
jgi:hypothetical protein